MSTEAFCFILLFRIFKTKTLTKKYTLNLEWIILKTCIAFLHYVIKIEAMKLFFSISNFSIFWYRFHYCNLLKAPKRAQRIPVLQRSLGYLPWILCFDNGLYLWNWKQVPLVSRLKDCLTMVLEICFQKLGKKHAFNFLLCVKIVQIVIK